MMRLDESGYLPRNIRPALDLALSDTPVVCLLDPRQHCKPTLTRHCEPARSYFSQDDRNYLDTAVAECLPNTHSWAKVNGPNRLIEDLERDLKQTGGKS